MEDKIQYLGDGLYVRYRNGQYELMANSAQFPSDIVYLEESVVRAFINVLEKDGVMNRLGYTKAKGEEHNENTR